jgi:chloride channel 3/4/5
MLCFLNPFTRMGGTELVANLFAECRVVRTEPIGGLDLCTHDPALLAGPVARSIGVALLVKGALTVVTFGIKLPAGIFIPTLGVGACAGRILGIFVKYWHWKHPSLGIFEVCRGESDCVIPGLYAMVRI